MDAFQPGAAAARPVSRLELSISCQNILDKDFLSKSDPFVVVIQGNGFDRRNMSWQMNLQV